MNVDLSDVFKKKDQIAWVGSGGKTSLIFSISNEIYKSAIITTTTHLAIDESRSATTHIRCENPDEWIKEIPRIDGLTLVTKKIDNLDTNRLSGYVPSELTSLSKYCLQNEIPLLIEADGSRQKPLKAPAFHEPHIPDFVNKVCVVMGLSGLGKPINEEWVHRPQNFRAVINKPSNHVIEIEDIFEYLIHQNGGLKSISPNVERLLFLNQIDTVKDKDSILILAEKCRHYFDHVFVTSINLVEKKLEIFAHFGQIACILLAAGESKRFGSPKQLALWQGKTFIRTLVEKIQSIHPSQFLVVLGAFSEQILPEIQQFPSIKIIHNSEWKSGQASSVKIAVENLPDGIDAVIFLLVDQPQIDVNTITNIIISHAKTNANIIAYNIDGNARHPILFSKKLFPQLIKITGNSGGKQLFLENPPLFLIFNDPNQAIDFDSFEDLANYLGK